MPVAASGPVSASVLPILTGLPEGAAVAAPANPMADATTMAAVTARRTIFMVSPFSSGGFARRALVIDDEIVGHRRSPHVERVLGRMVAGLPVDVRPDE